MARLRIAKSGGSVNDPVDTLVFDSDQDYMIMLEERIDTADGSGNITIAHNLGYLPAFYIFYEQSTGVWGRPLESGIGGNYADTTNIYIGATAGQRVKTVIFSNSQDNAIGTGRNNAFGKLKISKTGYDASVEKDLRRFVFASDNGIFKIKENKTLVVTVAGSDGTYSTTYAHSIGYIPQVYVFSAGLQIPIFQFVAAGVSYSIDFTVDATNITVSVTNSGGALDSPQDIEFNLQILLDKIE